jgi:hypothetical protein
MQIMDREGHLACFNDAIAMYFAISIVGTLNRRYSTPIFTDIYRGGVLFAVVVSKRNDERRGWSKKMDEN